MYDVRDARGRVVARTRTGETAHRVLRTRAAVGGTVNRARATPAEVNDLAHRVRNVLRASGFSEGSHSAHGTTVAEGYQPSVAGFVVRTDRYVLVGAEHESRVYVDHAGKGRADALPRYAAALRAAGLHVLEERRTEHTDKRVLWVSAEPISPRVFPPKQPGPLRRGKETDAVFARATSCRKVLHTYSGGDEAIDCAVAEAAAAFHGDKKAKMSLRDDGSYVFVISSHWGYDRYELTVA